MKQFLRLVCLAGALAGLAPAQARTDLAAELKQAQAALAAGDYDKAYPQYLEYAEKGNVLAQFTLAMFHQLGWGSRPQDPAQACAWHEKAAAADIPASGHFFAECLAQGTGRPADPAQAAVWYRRAAGLGYHLSLCALGDLYMAGEGVEKDPAEGLALCRKAAEKGAVPARLRVGRYLLLGDPAIRDPQAARAWFESIADTSPEAQFYLGVIARDGLGQPPAPQQARGWFERAASQGYLPAYFQTARLYFLASPDYQAQRPPADDLAKAYMWLSATLQRAGDDDELKQSRAMLAQVLAIMPESWRPTLDQRVAAHLAAHPSAP